MESNFARFSQSAETVAKQRALGLAQLLMELTGNSQTDTYKDTLELANKYKQSQANKGVSGFLGSIIGDPLTYAAIPAAKAVTGLSGAIKAGGAYGALTGGTNAIDSNQRLQNTLKDTAFGALLGAGMYGAGKVATSPVVKKLMADEFGGVGGDEIDLEALLRETDDYLKNRKIPTKPKEAPRPPIQIRATSEKQALAKSQGFDVNNPAFRGLARPYDEQKAAKRNYQMFTSDPYQASDYAEGAMGFTEPNILPAYLKKGKNLYLDAQGSNFNSLPVASLPQKIKNILSGSGNRAVTTDELAHAAKKLGYDSVSINNVYDNAWGERTGSPANVDVVFDPRNIRSIFAQFDPKKASSADLLAMRVPLTAGIGGAATYRGEND